MKARGITTENTVFVIVSFEGRDPYSLAGGLGVRVANLSETLADMGFPVHVFFIGDPKLPGEEVSQDGRLVLHRWCQWISHYYPQGVYQGENQKLYDFNKSLPPYVTDNIIKPAVAAGKLVVILSEEWQTAEVVCRFNDLLRSKGIRDDVVMLWNANNTFSFNRINGISYNTYEGFIQDDWKATKKLTINYGIRLTHFQPWIDREGYGYSIFNQSAYNQSCAAPPDYCGFEWHSKNSGVPLGGFPTRTLYYQPRIAQSIRAPHGESLREFSPLILRNIPISPESIEFVREALWGGGQFPRAVQEPGPASRDST
jgi:hypothetical protein